MIETKLKLAPLAFIIMLGAVIPFQTVQAQGKTAQTEKVKEMSLEEVLAVTEDANFQIRMAEADIDIVRSQYRQTNAAFLPQFSIEETGIRTNDPLSVFGFRLKQEAVSSADFSPARLNAPDSYNNFTTRFEVRQPLLNSDMLFKRSAVKNQLNATEEQFEGTLYYVRFQVKDLYYRMLLMQESLESIEKSLEAARENERQAGNFFEQDIINKADYLAAKVRLLELESRRSKVEDQLQTVRDNLKFMLGMDEDLRIVPTDSMESPRLSADYLGEVEPKVNSEIKALKYQVDAAEQMLKSARFSFVPSINLFGNYELNDEVLLGTQGESYMVGATLKWNLFSGFSNVGKVMESKAQLNKARIAFESRSFKNRQEVEQAKRAIRQAQVQLDFAESSVEQAAEDFRIRNDRYEQGMEKTTDLLAAEAKFSRARLQRLEALYQYHSSLARLELLLEQEMDPLK